MALLGGDTALVTGAASGIGRGIAKALAAEGVQLVLSDVAEEAGSALARELSATFIAADLKDPAAPRRLFDAAAKTLGAISILVHSASPRRFEGETVLAVTEAEWGCNDNSRPARRIRARPGRGRAYESAQDQRTNAVCNFAACSFTAEFAALQRDQSRSNHVGKRARACPRHRRHSC